MISLDMGGTSTDVSLFDEDYDYSYQLQVGEAQLQTQAFYIETVASGGGSICAYDGYHLTVGPESAGAQPGPAAYGVGGPLTLTDVHLLLGRIDQKQFGIPIFPNEAQQRLEDLQKALLEKTGKSRSAEDLLQGFVEISQEIMAGAIQKVTLARGIDPKAFCLLAFGGAGGLHACGIAELLQITDILIPEDAGLLSAYGISQALEQKISEKQLLMTLAELEGELDNTLTALEASALQELAREGFKPEEVDIHQRILFMRFLGQNHSLEIIYQSPEQDLKKEFQQAYREVYGHYLEDTPIEVESIRVIAREKTKATSQIYAENDSQYSPSYRHKQSCYFSGKWQEIPVYPKSSLQAGAYITEPALIVDPYSTSYLAPGWELWMDQNRTLIISRKEPTSPTVQAGNVIQEIELELFKRRFMRIAENMGVQLQRTSQSVNIKERLDFSCALLNAQGELVANAPHIPVHLGSLGICVREVMKALPIQQGDTLICNHPAFGGSHLPDITLISPVFYQEVCVAFVANRAHHAEIGGKRPGSMPPDAQNLQEEGVIIPPTYLAKGGEVLWDDIQQLLRESPYPSRSPAENLADIQ
ncbi:MAG: hydantoinase B/oxoprolinase family protein, partial [Bacteroidota bacterium]